MRMTLIKMKFSKITINKSESLIKMTMSRMTPIMTFFKVTLKMTLMRRTLILMTFSRTSKKQNDIWQNNIKQNDIQQNNT